MTLAEQCQKCGINYQILVFDDASKDRYKKINRRAETVFGVSYIEFRENMGRSKIRNKLGFNAMYDHLLFLDCDSKIISKKYIKNYLKVINKAPVIYGGTIYSRRAPKARSKKLHWLYGNKRERLPLHKRKHYPYQSFRSNNFIINRDIFLKHPFDEEITGYGHEDTLFAQDLEKSGHKILHIDNPVRHGGLEKTEKFLKKVEEGVNNLVKLRLRGKQIETSLTRFHSKLDRWGLLSIARFILKVLRGTIQRRLNSSNPSILWLDLYKLDLYDKALKKGNDD